MDIILFTNLLIFIFLLWFFYTFFFGAEFYPTRGKKLERMIEFARLKKQDVIYDLGCGDARIITKAAPKVKKATGIEIDPIRFLISWMKIKMLRLKNVKIIFADIFKTNFEDADVIFLFLRQKANDKLQKKFLQELKPGARIVSHYWIFKGWNPIKQDKRLKVYLYRFKTKKKPKTL